MALSTGIAFLVAFLSVVVSGRWVIERLRVLKFGQNINTDAPETHAKKQGTPTMGGVLLVIGVLVGLAVTGMAERSIGNVRDCAPLIAVVAVFLAHALIGFVDDWTSIKRGKSLGLKARYKLLAQFIAAGLFVLWLHAAALPDQTTISFGRGYDLGNTYYLVAFMLMVGLSNATNFTDGLDGLLGGTAILASIGVAVTVHALGPLASLPWFGYALAGACLGFLWYNAHPAKVFMGDTGSLPIGASLTAMTLIGKQEILLLIFSLVFIAEIVSVMIQVSYFKLTKGKRVFRMTPIHHHFEKLGWPETVVVSRFVIVGALALVAGLMLAPYL